MDASAFTLIVMSASILAGFFGSLTGLGGGMVVVPVLTLALGVDIRYAIGASLISVLATSTGSAIAYVRERFINMKVALFLSLATTFGAIIGVYIGQIMPPAWISIIFGSILLFTIASTLVKGKPPYTSPKPSPVTRRLHLDGSYIGPEGEVHYQVQGLVPAFGIMGLAGILSGLLGVGSGALKVFAMDSAMHMPFRVSTATSNLMIGMTAGASAGLYLNRGYIAPGIAVPVMVGVVVGAFIGAKMMKHIRTKWLRRIFSVCVLLIALQMIIHGVQSYG